MHTQHYCLHYMVQYRQPFHIYHIIYFQLSKYFYFIGSYRAELQSNVVNPLAMFSVLANKAVPATFKMFSSMSAAEQINFTKKAIREKANPGAELNPQMKRLLNDRAFFIESIKKVYNL